MDEFLRQRTARRAREADEALERARRLRQEKEEAARKIQAELERASADEEAASLRRGTASALVPPPLTSDASRSEGICQNRPRSDSGRCYDRCQSRSEATLVEE